MTYDDALAAARVLAVRTAADAAVTYSNRGYHATDLAGAKADDVVVEVAAPKERAP